MTMQPAISRKQISAFAVIGISARTNNALESGPDGAIPKIWHRFVEEKLDQKIPNRVGQEVYAVYTDYASDHNGDYTFVAGPAVKPGTVPPDGMVAVTVPAGTYTVLTTEQGPFPKVIPEAWMRIFKLEAEGKLHRAYKTDFELYDQRALNPQDAQVDIYLGEK